MQEDKSVEILSQITTFMKYAKYVPELQRRETWEDLVERNRAMHVKKYPGMADVINWVYEYYVLPKKILPSMRSLQFGGKPIEHAPNRIFNCFSGETKFLTYEGEFSFSEKVGEQVQVLTEDGNWRDASVESFGEQWLNTVVLKPPYRTNLRATYNVTPDHRWILEDGSVTTSLSVGDRVKTSVSSPDKECQEYFDGFGHGVVFADGSRQTKNLNRYMVRLCGEKENLLNTLQKHHSYRSVCYPPSGGGDPFVTLVSDSENYKELPGACACPQYLAGFIEGWLTCDGYTKKTTESWQLDTQNREAADWLLRNAAYSGYVATGVTESNAPTNYGERSSPLIRVSLRKECPYYVVESIRSASFKDEVYCVVEPTTKSFTLSGGVLTGNCAYVPCDAKEVFSEAMFLLLGGTGVGFSVQRHHVEKLPLVVGPLKKKKRFLIGDSIEGWSDAVKVLCEAYFEGKAYPQFDYSDIRQKGAALITSGGKAPGPQPLKDCIHNLEKMFNRVLESRGRGVQLKPIEVHDMMCYIADAVLAGGIRRAALISLFSMDDEEMLTCKYGNWWEEHPQRGRANNSAVILRHKVTRKDFDNLWDKIVASGTGEPGVYFSNDKEWGTNPCCEIGLRPYQFCNLCDVNVSDVVSQEDLNERSKAAAFIGTLQAGYTDFHYLRDIWKENTEKDALIGVGMTGIGSGAVLKYDLEEAAQEVLKENERVAAKIGINKAARTSTIKPSGTSSLVLGCASGIHAWHNDYYIRRIRVGKNESIYRYLAKNHPELVEDEFFRPNEQAVIEIPQKAPIGSILRHESPFDLLERVSRFNKEWVKPGHRDGQNSHNVSCTISVKDDEWENVGEWMWKNRHNFNGISVLPYAGGTYQQAPFEDITEEQYKLLVTGLTDIDLRNVVEEEDNTDLSGELACSAGGCAIV